MMCKMDHLKVMDHGSLTSDCHRRHVGHPVGALPCSLIATVAS